MSKYVNGNTPEPHGRSAQITQAQLIRIKSTFRDLGITDNADQLAKARQILEIQPEFERWTTLSKAAGRHLLAVLWELNRVRIIDRLKQRAQLAEVEMWDD